MHSPTWPVDVDDNGMMHHAIHDSGGDHGIAEVVAELAEPYVRCHQRGSLAITAVNDLKEQRGVFGVLLLQPIEAYFIDEEDIRRSVSP